MVYVTMDDVLKRQVERKARALKIEKLEFLAYDELGLRVDPDKMYILDEYYEIIESTKVTMDEILGINPLFKMGTYFKCIMTSAHSSQHFQNYLLTRFSSKGIAIQIHNSIAGKVGE